MIITKMYKDSSIVNYPYIFKNGGYDMEKIEDTMTYYYNKFIEEKKAKPSLKDKVKRPQTLDDLAINKYYGKLKKGGFCDRI